MQSVCAPVCSAVLWCAFDTTHIYWVQHWYCLNAAPSFSEHTYDIPLRDALWGNLLGQRQSVLYLKRLYALKRAATALLGYHQKPNRSKSGHRPNSNRAVKMSVHYTAFNSPHHCVQFVRLVDVALKRGVLFRFVFSVLEVPPPGNRSRAADSQQT